MTLRLSILPGTPLHPERAALFGAPHLSASPATHHQDMFDGDPRERTPIHSVHPHHYHHPPIASHGSATHRRAPTPDVTSRGQHHDQANNNFEYSGKASYNLYCNLCDSIQTNWWVWFRSAPLQEAEFEEQQTSDHSGDQLLLFGGSRQHRHEKQSFRGDEQREELIIFRSVFIMSYLCFYCRR